MNTAIMISIQPKWCSLIARGQKTIEVRKTRPKLETPFTCYIYQTKGVWSPDMLPWTGAHRGWVIGEFVCDSWVGWGVSPVTGLYMILPHELAQTGMPARDFESYGDGKWLYGWHISNLKIYEKPRELQEFYVERDATTDYPQLTPMKHPPQSWCYAEGDNCVGEGKRKGTAGLLDAPAE